MILAAVQQQGLIKAFEPTIELAWNRFRDLLDSQGNDGLLGSRDSRYDRCQFFSLK